MKTVFASLLIALSLTTATITFANTGSDIDSGTDYSFESTVFALAESAKVDVVVENKASKNMLISLINKKGETLANQRLSKNEKVLRARFDLADLQDGAYRIEITDGDSTEVQAFNLATTNNQPVRSIAVQ